MALLNQCTCQTAQNLMNCWKSAALSRSIFTTTGQSAGFQGLKGSTASSDMLRNRIQRKKKQVNKLENVAMEMKPIKDFSIRYSWKTPERRRHVAISEEELEGRILLQKEWTNFVLKRSRDEGDKLMKMKMSQEKALYELKQESEDLYQAALEVDENLFPLSFEGPSETPYLKNYKAPLGSLLIKEDSFD